MTDASQLPALDPERIFRVFAEHGVEYVLIGALAARFAGYPLLTADADMTPSRSAENLGRLAAALREIDARVFTVGVPEGLSFDCSAATLARGEIWNLVTAAGRLDLVFFPPGGGDYDELLRHSSRYEVAGAPVTAASLEAIVSMKEAADRPKDRQAVAIIKAMLERDARRRS
ncbi:MAG: hypothetical protein KF709_03780 [Gemmatimonadaceae bacterium]|nr:hypothetical protein [Gemmatimonadaceae bacterium]